MNFWAQPISKRFYLYIISIHLLLDSTIIYLFYSTHCATLFWCFWLFLSLLSPIASWSLRILPLNCFFYLFHFCFYFWLSLFYLEHILVFEYPHTILISYSRIFFHIHGNWESSCSPLRVPVTEAFIMQDSNLPVPYAWFPSWYS